MVFTCQPGFEDLVERELRGAGLGVEERGCGWLTVRGGAPGEATRMHDWCFAHAVLLTADEVGGNSVNALAAAIAEKFLASVRGERIEQPWPLVVLAAAELDGLGRRAAAVEGAVRDLLKRKIARVARLATGTPPRTGEGRGLFLFFADFGRVFVARSMWSGGQRRMADDPGAPSRSYLKVEEAYGILGVEPAAGETVVDLGAAPGGWSFSAARRGATVIAIDNGPLKGGALGHPQIEHRREDAYRFRPAAGTRYDWLFCDMVDDPHEVLRAIVEPWIAQRWCRRFVINLKFGRADAVAVLDEVRRRLGPRCAVLTVRHLFHDREEFTLVGEVA
ncbi:MAG: rRNA methyltransferase [Opitutaceae bacterium]|nr:rRNA methyltransferase [Opitutaceae bacterium]